MQGNNGRLANYVRKSLVFLFNFKIHKKYNTVKHLQRQQLLFTKAIIESEVFLKVLTVI